MSDVLNVFGGQRMKEVIRVLTHSRQIQVLMYPDCHLVTFPSN